MLIGWFPFRFKGTETFLDSRSCVITICPLFFFPLLAVVSVSLLVFWVLVQNSHFYFTTIRIYIVSWHHFFVGFLFKFQRWDLFLSSITLLQLFFFLELSSSLFLVGSFIVLIEEFDGHINMMYVVLCFLALSSLICWNWSWKSIFAYMLNPM